MIIHLLHQKIQEKELAHLRILQALQYFYAREQEPTPLEQLSHQMEAWLGQLDMI